MKNTIKIIQTRSSIGRLKSHKKTLRCLSLRRINHIVEHEDTPSIRGMINLVSYMVKIKNEK